MTLARSVGAVHYPEADDMGEGELPRLISELLRPLLARFLAERGVAAHVGADQFLYFREGDPTQRVAPDVYVLPGVPQSRIAPSWKLWEIGVAPSFCLEIVSSDVVKDYEDTPALLGGLGTRELIVFDPEAAGRRARVRWQVFRSRGSGFQLVERSDADRVRSVQLGCFLRVVGKGAEQRVRIATGSKGEVLYPTMEEIAEAERAARELERAEKERERAEKERERAEKERERAARVALEARVAELEAAATKARSRRK